MCLSVDLTFASAYSCCIKWHLFFLCFIIIERECASICVRTIVIIYYIFNRMCKVFGCCSGSRRVIPYAGINLKLP